MTKRFTSTIEQGFWTGMMSTLSVDFMGHSINATRWANPWDGLTQHRMMRHAMGAGVALALALLLITGTVSFAMAGFPALAWACVMTLIAAQVATTFAWLKTSHDL